MCRYNDGPVDDSWQLQVRGFVEDSVSYLRGLFSPWELPQAIFYHRNRMITKVWMALRRKRGLAPEGGRAWA